MSDRGGSRHFNQYNRQPTQAFNGTTDGGYSHDQSGGSGGGKMEKAAIDMVVVAAPAVEEVVSVGLKPPYAAPTLIYDCSTATQE